MTLPQRYATQQAKAKRRGRLNAKARHQRQQQQAQRAINAWHQALHDLGLPDNLMLDILYYTSPVLFKGPMSMDEIIFNLTHHWSSVNCKALERYGLS